MLSHRPVPGDTSRRTLLTAALALAGCEDPEPQVPAPAFGEFHREVYPVLLRDCAFSGCHGDPRRPLFVPGPGRTRLDPTTAVLDPATDAELARAYDRARGLLLLEGDEPPPLLHKPTAEAAHRGRDAHGNNVYEDPYAPGRITLERWARPELP